MQLAIIGSCVSYRKVLLSINRPHEVQIDTSFLPSYGCLEKKGEKTTSERLIHGVFIGDEGLTCFSDSYCLG